MKAFKDLGLNPKYDTPEEFEKWLKEMADRKTDTHKFNYSSYKSA